MVFVLRLCDHFKILDPQVVLALPADTLSTWLAYCQVVGPFGVDRPDYQNAFTASMVANTANEKNKLTALDCMIFKPQKTKPTVDELRQKILGGTK